MSENSFKIREKFINKLVDKLEDLNSDLILLAKVDKKIYKKNNSQKGGAKVDTMPLEITAYTKGYELQDQQKKIKEAIDKAGTLTAQIAQINKVLEDIKSQIDGFNVTIPDLSEINLDVVSLSEDEKKGFPLIFSDDPNKMSLADFKSKFPNIVKQLPDIYKNKFNSGPDFADTRSPLVSALSLPARKNPTIDAANTVDAADIADAAAAADADAAADIADAAAAADAADYTPLATDDDATPVAPGAASDAASDSATAKLSILKRGVNAMSNLRQAGKDRDMANMKAAFDDTPSPPPGPRSAPVAPAPAPVAPGDPVAPVAPAPATGARGASGFNLLRNSVKAAGNLRQGGLAEEARTANSRAQ